MNTVRAVVVVADDELFAQHVRHDIESASPEEITVRHCSFADVLKQPSEDPPLFILIDVRRSSDLLIKSTEEIAAHFENSRIIGLGYPSDVQQILDFIKMGVRDFLSLPIKSEDFLSMYNQAKNKPASVPKGAAMGKIIVVYGPKGGTGATLLAVNLGVSLAKSRPGRVAICDLSLEVGDVTTYLNLNAKYTIRDIIENDRRIDTSFLKGVMLEHASGVCVLATTHQDQVPISYENLGSLKAILMLLIKHYEHVIVDVGHIVPSLLYFFFSEADALVLVGNPDVPSLKGLVGVVKRLAAMRCSADKIKIVINRFNSKNQVDIHEFEKAAAKSVDFCIPNNYPVCIQAVNRGEPINKIMDRSDIGKKIDELAAAIVKQLESKKIDAPKPGAPKSDFPDGVLGRKEF